MMRHIRCALSDFVVGIATEFCNADGYDQASNSRYVYELSRNMVFKCTILTHAIPYGTKNVKVDQRVRRKISWACHFGSHEHKIALGRYSELVNGAGAAFVPSSLVNCSLQLDFSLRTTWYKLGLIFIWTSACF